MTKKKNDNKRVYGLLTVFLVLVIGLLAFVAFYFYDLGHKIAILGYKRISTCEELQSISGNPSGKYRLTKDIDMQGKEWTPFTFTGVLDGDGHSISNLSITAEGSSLRDTYDGNMKCYSTSLSGMFDVIEGARINNLTLDSVCVNIESDTPCFIGAIAGYMGDSTISGCKVTGDVRLYAHDRMFGVGGVVGYGNGTLKDVESDVILVCVDTDSETKDEQFMGGLIGAGYPECLNCRIKIEGYASEHGYAHNGGLIGMYEVYPEGKEHPGKMFDNNVEGKITFFEDNDDRRAYCSDFIGEQMSPIADSDRNYSTFQRVEVFNCDAVLLPEERSEILEADVSEQGYFDLKADYENAGADATYGLFVNGRFLKKVRFPQGKGTVTETVFLDEGKNEIKFRFLPGDGDISFGTISVSESDKSVVLIVAPHEDDEIFAFAGTIQKTIAKGNIVKVLFLTTGDYFHTDFTSVRLAESVSALSILGVDSSDITFLGYGDLTLEALLTSEDPDATFQAHSGSALTYGDARQNIFDYHFLNCGYSAGYSANNLRSDFRDAILAIRPDRVYTVSEFEWHTDHQYACHLTQETLKELSGQMDYHPVFCETAVHGEDTDWPEPLKYNADGSVAYECFTDPFPTGNISLKWEDAIKITLTDKELEKKMACIGEFHSQNDPCEYYDGTKDYNYSFCKKDEFYWEISY